MPAPWRCVNNLLYILYNLVSHALDLFIFQIFCLTFAGWIWRIKPSQHSSSFIKGSMTILAEKVSHFENLLEIVDHPGMSVRLILQFGTHWFRSQILFSPDSRRILNTAMWYGVSRLNRKKDLECPSQSPDLNPTGDLWDDLEHRLHSRPPQHPFLNIFLRFWWFYRRSSWTVFVLYLIPDWLLLLQSINWWTNWTSLISMAAACLWHLNRCVRN